MVYLFESKLPEAKPVHFGLTSIYGIGVTNSMLLCKKLGFSKNLKVKNLSLNQINQTSKVLDSLKYLLANDLKKINLQNKQKLLTIKSYKGLRRKKGFPIRGQRTHTNAKTARKNR
jgi:small subunit ribosomal protein S13